MSPRAQAVWKQWLPFFTTTLLNVIGGVVFAIHVSDQTAQNAKDIAEIKLVLVPRPEVKQDQDATEKQLHSMDTKLDILLNRQQDTHNER